MIFTGKQTGYSDPTIAHESVLKACTALVVFSGKQSNYADPSIAGCIVRLPEQE